MRRPCPVDFAREARHTLANTPGSVWALVFVELRMMFNRLYPHGLLSTAHGAEFFDNVLAGAAAWTEEVEGGEYGNNFRKMLHDYADPSTKIHS